MSSKLTALPDIGTFADADLLYAVKSSDTSGRKGTALALQTKIVASIQGSLDNADSAVQPADLAAIGAIVAVSSGRALALTDNEKRLHVTGEVTLSIPLQASVAWPAGAVVAVLAVSAPVTITAEAGATLNGVDGASEVIDGPFASAVLERLSENAWSLTGALAA